MNQDFIEFITILNKYRVKFVIIGGIALAFYGYPRFTGDIDIWIKPDIENVRRLFEAIKKFFNTDLSASPEEFLAAYYMISLGEEPVKIELHHTIDGVTAEEIWDTKVSGTFGNEDAYYISVETFIKNKKHVGRDQDIVDIKKLSEK